MGILRILLALPVLGLAILCSAAAVATQAGRFSPRLDVASHFAPAWLAGGMVVLLLAWIYRPGAFRALLLLQGLVAVAGAGEPIAAELLRPMSPRAAPDAPNQLKLIQFNSWGRNADPEPMADWLVSQDPDIIVVEEASAALRRALLERRPYHVSCRRCSVQIFSLQEPAAEGLPYPGPGPWPQVGRATFAARGGAFTVVGAHFTWPTQGDIQQRQATRLFAALEPFPKDRLILSGDFNSTPWSFTRRAQDRTLGLERRTRALFSWPAARYTRWRIDAPFPILPIDHVYAGSDWKTVAVERGPRLGSDHYPVVVTLALTP